MDHYADDVAAVVNHLGVQGAVHVGHSTGGGEVIHYVARHGEPRRQGRADQRRSAADGQDGQQSGRPAEGRVRQPQAQLAANRAQFYYDVPAGPFCGYNRDGAKPSQGVIWNWWRQGMMGSARPTTTASSRSRRPTSPKT